MPKTDLRRPGLKFPDLPVYSGFNAPARIEADIYDLEVTGEIPIDLNGAYYRSNPDPQYPVGEQDIHINGDGMVAMYRFQNGRIDFKSRYVMTDKLKHERAARKALFGAYRNPYTDDVSVQGVSAATANTTPFFHANKLLALKENGLPVELDPLTLETLGNCDFNGQITSKTFTAHPRVDPKTGNLVAYGAGAKGGISTDIAVYEINPYGQVVREEWFHMPYPAMVHDFVLTEDYYVFPIFPSTSSEERLKAKELMWQWDPNKKPQIGVIPRKGTAADIKWIEAPLGKCYHYINAYNEGSKIIMDGGVADAEFFPAFYPDTNGNDFDPVKASINMRRWTIDFDSADDAFEEEILFNDFCEFPWNDRRFNTQPYRYCFSLVIDPSKETIAHPSFQPNFGVLKRYDLIDRTEVSWSTDPTRTLGEPVFVPRHFGSNEGDGYLLVPASRHDTFTTELLVFDALEITSGPIAIIHTPLRQRASIHSAWVSEVQLEVR